MEKTLHPDPGSLEAGFGTRLFNSAGLVEANPVSISNSALASRWSDLFVMRANELGFTQGTINVLVKDGELLGFGASKMVDGGGASTLTPLEFKTYTQSFRGPWRGGCAEPQSIKPFWTGDIDELRQMLGGAFSSARSLQTRFPKPACRDCKGLLKDIGINDPHAILE